MIGTAAALLLAASAGAQAGASVYASKKQSKAAKEAADAETKANADALAFEREQAAETKRQFDLQEAARKQAWDTEQNRLADVEARKEPLRQARYNAMRSLGARYGWQMPEYQAPARQSAQMPEGWKIGDPVPGTSTTMPVSGNTGYSPNGQAVPKASLASRVNPRLSYSPLAEVGGLSPQLQPYAAAQPDPNLPSSALGDTALQYRRQYARSV